MSSQYTIHHSLRHLHCLGNVRYCSPRCLHANDLPLLADGTFPHDEVKLTSHKKLTFGVAKVVLISTLLFKDYIVSFTHFCQTCYQVYTHHIDNFSGSDSMSNTMKNKFGKFLQELFSSGVYASKPGHYWFSEWVVISLTIIWTNASLLTFTSIEHISMTLHLKIKSVHST